MRIPFLYTFFFFFLALLIISFLILPTSQELISQRKKLLDLKADLRNQESYFLQIKNTAAELKKYEEALSKIDSALPSTLNLPELFILCKKFQPKINFP
jgi:Tfp pilus assembly protein PilO